MRVIFSFVLLVIFFVSHGQTSIIPLPKIMETRSGQFEWRYERNKENVTENSQVYLKPLKLRVGETVKFAVFRNERQSGTDYYPKTSRR